MNPITFPIKPQDSGDVVNNLQQAILALASRINATSFRNFFDNRDLQKLYAAEVKAQRYGDATRQIILLFQQFYMT